ncbi:MAG TPA: MFS transporter, partial [Gaiellaceae bacterium]|nr:MFS transporter [Gaiellaceae bacterium]
VSAIAFQQGAHFGALRSGLALVPMALAFLAASLSTARLTARYGRRVLSTGALLQGAGLVGLAGTLLAAWPGVDPVNMAPAMAVAGFGQGLVLSPLFGFVLAGVPAERAGVGSGVLTTTQQTALALGVAGLGSLFLSLASSRSLGTRDAFVFLLGIQSAVAVLVAVAGRTLQQPAPRPARVSEELPEAAFESAA